MHEQSRGKDRGKGRAREERRGEDRRLEGEK